jgi:hypothetical protein
VERFASPVRPELNLGIYRIEGVAMPQLHQYMCRIGLALVIGLLTSCGIPVLPPANVPLEPTNQSTDPRTAIAPSIAYPAPYPAPQQPSPVPQATFDAVVARESTTVACRLAAAQELRVENVGIHAITGLSVFFPGHPSGSATTQIAFGDIAAGSVSVYKTIPGGVYGYGAYHYTVDGKTIDQPVLDWVGERPMDGYRFTYHLTLDLTTAPDYRLALVRISVDDLQPASC